MSLLLELTSNPQKPYSDFFRQEEPEILIPAMPRAYVDSKFDTCGGITKTFRHLIEVCQGHQKC